MHGDQLATKLLQWLPLAEQVLTVPGLIPSIQTIQRLGRRVQDKAKLEKQMEKEREKASRVTREKLTAEVLAVRGRSIELSNDVQLKLGLELVDVRAKLVELSTVRFWKSVQTSSVKELMGLAIQAMPRLGLVVQVEESECPTCYKKKVLEIISLHQNIQGDI